MAQEETLASSSKGFFREAVSDCRQSWRRKLQVLAFASCSVIHKHYHLVRKKSLPSHWALPGENLATFTGLRHCSAPQSCAYVDDTHSLGFYLILKHSLRASSTSHTLQCSHPRLTINPNDIVIWTLLTKYYKQWSKTYLHTHLCL